MKKTIFSTMFAAAALTLGFTSCNNDDVVDGGSSANPQTVKVKLNNAPGTRAEGADASTEVTTLAGGYIYFVGNAGNITKCLELGTSTVEGVSVSIADLSGSGATIANIPGSPTSVYVAGNVGTDIPRTGMISSVQTYVVNVASQAKSDGSVDNVYLYGTGNIAAPVTAGNPSTANFDLSPISARIQISQISQKADSKITSYKVEGIYINNYYSTMNLNGTLVTPSSLVNNGTSTTAYAGGSSEYPTTMSGIIYDNTSALSSDAATPYALKPVNAGKVWAYNVLAPKADGVEVPHIVIKVTDVVINGTDATTYAGDWFLTVKKYKVGGNEVTKFEPRNIYKIANIAFGQTDLTDVPEAETISVDVDIDILPWIPNDTEVEF